MPMKRRKNAERRITPLEGSKKRQADGRAPVRDRDRFYRFDAMLAFDSSSQAQVDS
jgi:hypothetical protein